MSKPDEKTLKEIFAQLELLENKYGMPSVDFYFMWRKGLIPEPEDPDKHGDFMLWSGLMEFLLSSYSCVLVLPKMCISEKAYELLSKAFGEALLKRFIIFCTSPTGRCILPPIQTIMVERVAAHQHDNYWENEGKSMKHKRIDVSRFCVNTCGSINRVFLREDGAIVFSHSMVTHPGVHVVVPADEIKAKIVEGFNSL